MRLVIFSVVLLLLKFDGIYIEACFTQPERTWPLGQGIINREIVTADSPEARGDFAFVGSPLPYNGLQFYGNSSSYVDIRFTDLSNDFTLYFYINPTEHGGRILHYLSNDEMATGITGMILDMESDGRLTYSIFGNGITLDNGGTDTGTFTVPLNTWSIIMIEIDVSKKNVKITNDDYATEMSDSVLGAGATFVAPGIMRIASSQSSGGSFRGGISCLHKVPAKNVCEDPAFITECDSNWPTTTSTTSSTSTSTTSTTTPTTTSTTTITTTSTPVPTTTTTSAPTTTSATTPAPTTTSTSTTLSPTSTTTSTSTSPTTIPVTTAYIAQLSPAPPTTISIQTGCRQYSIFNNTAVYASSSDVITVNLVNDIRECLLECDLLAECMTLSFDSTSGRCSTGKVGPALQFSSDTSMYEVV